jgi:hypothetical protein
MLMPTIWFFFLGCVAAYITCLVALRNSITHKKLNNLLTIFC